MERSCDHYRNGECCFFNHNVCEYEKHYGTGIPCIQAEEECITY